MPCLSCFATGPLPASGYSSVLLRVAQLLGASQVLNCVLASPRSLNNISLMAVCQAVASADDKEV